MVSSLGTSGAKGKLFSFAILTIIKRKASEGVNPIAAKTASASFFISPSILARTVALVVILIFLLLGYIVAQKGDKVNPQKNNDPKKAEPWDVNSFAPGA
jgi:hypothetical protein